MKKRAITTFILISVISFAVSGVSKIKCDTLFQFLKDESVYNSCEPANDLVAGFAWSYQNFYCTITPSNEFRYACVATNSRNSSATLVWNGERKIFSDNCASLQISNETLDFINFSKCSYQYEINNEQFLVIEGFEYGPYEEINYTPPHKASHTYINRTHFEFTQMGSEFIHYHDGIILPTNVPRKEYYSKNGLHKVVFSDDWSTITLDGKKINIPQKTTPINRCYDVCVFDNGTCFFSTDFRPWNGRLVTPISQKIYVSAQGVQVYTLDYYYNFKTNKIENYYNDKKISYDSDLSFDIEGTFYDQGFLLQDCTKTHTFISKEGYDYVLIDGKKYGKRAPLEAFYVEQTNSFMWVAEEDGCLVLYTYILD